MHRDGLLANLEQELARLGYDQAIGTLSEESRAMSPGELRERIEAFRKMERAR